MKKSANEPHARPPLASLLAAAFACFLLAGCAGYQLGPTNGLPAGSRSIQVNIFQNGTLEPRLSEPVATALRRELQRDATFRLATRGRGDIVVNGVITEFRRSGVSFEPGDIITVRDYELMLIARIRAVEPITGRVLLDQDVHGRTVIRTGPDLSAAERQAIPLLAQDLARNATSLLVDGTW